LSIEDDHRLITQNRVPTKRNVSICFDVHPKSHFTFKELSFFIDETQEDDFGVESLAAGDDEALETVNLGAAGGRESGGAFLVGFEDIVVLS
jgi:hypothetical protein